MKRRKFIKTVGFSLAGMAIASQSLFGQRGRTSGQVLVEAACFADKGGWVLDTQFMDQMGAPYLLAHGMGVPVKNAKTTVAFPSTGKYNLWVRTKNWCPGEWEAPGQFKVIVNGVENPTIFGTESDWAWQRGGAIEITNKEAVVELKDLTGFEGRCDAVFFTQDNSIPPGNLKEMIAWRDALQGRSNASLPEEAFDVVIIGGGVAGCAAALAAQNQGLRVALIQERPVFGGNASSEIRVHTEGIRGKNTAIIMAIDTAQWQFNGSEKAFDDDQKRQKAIDAAPRIHQFKNYHVDRVQMNGNRIVSVDARNTGTLVSKRFLAPVFIDCSGDGAVGALAGAEFRYGRESKDEFGEGWPEQGELWSPDKPDQLTMGTSVLWNTERKPAAENFPKVPWATPVAGNHASSTSEWFWEYAPANKHQIDDAEYIRDHMFRAIYGTFYNAKQQPGNENLALKWVGFVGGKRESRRLMGDYIYTLPDVAQKRVFDDAVVEEKRPVDVHYQKVVKNNEKPDFLSTAIFYKSGAPYYLPFRCLYSKNIENLMMAGRCFSASHIGLGGPRVMRTCGQMGIATGYAASLCIKHKVTPRGVYQNHIKELRTLVGYV